MDSNSIFYGIVMNEIIAKLLIQYILPTVSNPTCYVALTTKAFQTLDFKNKARGV